MKTHFKIRQFKMPVLSSPIFVADTKIILGYNFVAPLILNLGRNCQLTTVINIILPKLATSVNVSENMQQFLADFS